MKQEKVLVFPKTLLDSLGTFRGMKRICMPYLSEIFRPHNLLFMPRSEAEENPEYKQIIPYILLVYQGDVFTYYRTSKCGEEKLKFRWSIGIGGHVNSDDGDISNPMALYSHGMSRELNEEIILKPENLDASHISGIIYDDRSLLGQVHFGIVHVMEVNTDDLEINDPALEPIGFLPKKDVCANYRQYERWSQIVIDNLLQNRT